MKNQMTLVAKVSTISDLKSLFTNVEKSVILSSNVFDSEVQVSRILSKLNTGLNDLLVPSIVDRLISIYSKYTYDMLVKVQSNTDSDAKFTEAEKRILFNIKSGITDDVIEFRLEMSKLIDSVIQDELELIVKSN